MLPCLGGRAGRVRTQSAGVLAGFLALEAPHWQSGPARFIRSMNPGRTLSPHSKPCVATLPAAFTFTAAVGTNRRSLLQAPARP